MTAVREKVVVWSTGIAVALLGLGLLIAFSLLRSVTRPITKMQATVTAIADGDYAARSQLGGDDEFGQLSRAFDDLLDDRVARLADAERENEDLNNSVVQLLQAVAQLSNKDLTAKAPVTANVIGTVSDSINLLSYETGRVLSEVTSIAAQVKLSTERVKRQGESVTATAAAERSDVERAGENLANASKVMTQVAELAAASNRAAEQATSSTVTALASVNETVKGMEGIRESIAESEKRIKRLGERSQEITGIVNLINTIAERTHVLALNASMQAAAAGDAGRGFAVVAEEVQRLAESSRQATQQIAQLVNNIQIETSDTINTVNKTIAQVVLGFRDRGALGRADARNAAVHRIARGAREAHHLVGAGADEDHHRAAQPRAPDRRQHGKDRGGDSAAVRGHRGPVEVRRPAGGIGARVQTTHHAARPNGRHGTHQMRGQDLLTALADELKGLAPELAAAYDSGSCRARRCLCNVRRAAF